MIRANRLMAEILCGALATLLSLTGNAANRARTQEPTERAGVVADEPGRTLATFRTYFVNSDTIYMKAETLQGALEQRPEFAAWGVQATSDRQKADVIIEVTLPFLTWEWNYKIKRGTGSTVLAIGKVKALTEGIAAPQLAAEMAGRIKLARALPQAREESASPMPDRKSEPALPNREWKVEFVSGPTNLNAGKGTLTTSHDRMLCRAADGPTLTILAKDVVAVEHVSEKNHMEWADVWEAANPKSEVFVQTLGQSVILIPFALVGGVIVEAWPAEQFIKVDWRENDVLQNVVLKTGDFKALLKELAMISNGTEVDVAAEARLVRQALTKPDRESWLIQIKQAVWVGWKYLPAGTYEVVCIPREGHFGAVYFIASTADSTPAGPSDATRKAQPEAHAVVQVETREGESAASASENTRFANVQYKTENGMPRITEISKGDRVWLFTLAPLRLEPVPEAKN